MILSRKWILMLCLLFLSACKPNESHNNIGHSITKKEFYVKECVKEKVNNLKICVCQYDVVDPIFSLFLNPFWSGMSIPKERVVFYNNVLNTIHTQCTEITQKYSQFFNNIDE